MRDILTHHKLDPWGKLALSRLEFGKGDVAAATAAVVDAVRMQPDNAHLHLTAGHRLIEFGLIAEAEQICGRQLADPGGEHGLPDMEVEGLRFRLNLAKRDYAAIVEECRSQAFLRQLPDWLVVEALLKISAAGESPTDIENEIIDSFCGFLETRRPYALNIVVGLFQCYARQRRWEKIDALDAAIRSSSFYDHPDLLIRRFDILCARSRLDDARVLYLSHYANAKLRQWEACSVLRFLAESKLWDAAAELLFYFIESRFDFPGGEYFILRVCRRTNIHRAIISRIDASSGEHPPAQFAMLRDLLADDLAIRGASVLDSPGGGTPLAVSARNRILQSSVRSPPAQAAVGYLCADKAYFFSVLTFLASLAAQGGRGQTVAWYVFVAKDVPASWRQLLSQFAARIGLNVTSVPEADFVEGDAIHVEAYGIFTGGTTLSRAAFLRIYAARYLFNLGKVERAYYVDSDIIANSDFQKLMDVPFGDALILARAEEFNAEVRTVTEKHGLAERSYFNSGVLAFDFRKREILSHIDKAVMLSESETHRLVFHDQCALNIAFAGSVEYLGPEYNYFLRPHRKENGDFSEAVLIHVLDRPKPWDLSYSREYRSLWTQPAAIVRALVPPSDYGALVAAANQ
jgi:lipopolysaccharide biosynthesis glycosyltransferase